MNNSIEPRREVTDLKRKEPLDLRFKGPARIGPYRRWLRRCLVEAEAAGNDAEVNRITQEMRKAGLADG